MSRSGPIAQLVALVSLPESDGIGISELPAAIADGRVKAVWLECGLRTRESAINEELYEALKNVEYLVVVDAFDSPLARIANVVLPLSLNLEKDGTFTSFDRTVQRVRAAVPPPGEAHDSVEIVGAVADRMGYTLPKGHVSQVMNEIATIVPGYGGVSYARLERGGIVTPIDRLGGESESTLSSSLNPSYLNSQA